MHTPAISLLTLAAKHGWTAAIRHDVDFSNRPDILISAYGRRKRITARWVDRGDGYTLTSCRGAHAPWETNRSMTLEQARAMVKGVSHA